MRPMVEIMFALRSFRILRHWLDPGKGITGLAGAFASYYALKEQLITY